MPSRSTPSARKSSATGRNGWRRTSGRLIRSPTHLHALQAAVEDRRLGRHPCRSSTVGPPAAAPGRVEAWPPERVLAVREALADRYQLLPVIGAGPGLRQREALGLTLEDIDFAKEVVHVRRQVKMVRAKLCFALPEVRKVRDVPLPLSVARAEGHQPELLQLLRVEACAGHGGCDRTARGGGADGARVWEPSREHGFHALRHFYASEELEAGESIVSLAQWLGHPNPGFTLRKYSHFLLRAGARGSAAIDAIFA